MRKLIHLLVMAVLLTMTTLAFSAKNNFQFQINDYHTQRQAGQTLDVYVRYAMQDNVDYSQYPDYRELRNIVAGYLEPSDSLPVNTFWEIIAEKIAANLQSRYPLSGISVQLLVYPNVNGGISEPGFHGPIYTIGDVLPLTQVVMPASRFRHACFLIE